MEYSKKIRSLQEKPSHNTFVLKAYYWFMFLLTALNQQSLIFFKLISGIQQKFFYHYWCSSIDRRLLMSPLPKANHPPQST